MRVEDASHSISHECYVVPCKRLDFRIDTRIIMFKHSFGIHNFSCCYLRFFLRAFAASRLLTGLFNFERE